MSEEKKGGNKQGFETGKALRPKPWPKPPKTDSQGSSGKSSEKKS